MYLTVSQLRRMLEPFEPDAYVQVQVPVEGSCHPYFDEVHRVEGGPSNPTIRLWSDENSHVKEGLSPCPIPTEKGQPS